jgi:hypothetical protein
MSEEDTARAGAVARVLALLGAMLVGLIATAISVGFALAAPLGMWYAAVLARRRGRTFTRGATWVSAVAGVLVAIVLGLGALTVHDPGMWRPIFSVADSTTSAPAASTPPPAFLERLAPESVRQATSTARPSTMLVQVILAWSLGFALVLGSAIYGTVGWTVGMLVGFAVRGRWPGRRAPTSAWPRF